MKVIRKTRKGQKVNSEIGCELLELFFDPAFSVIEILAETFIESHEVGRANIRVEQELHWPDSSRPSRR